MSEAETSGKMSGTTPLFLVTADELNGEQLSAAIATPEAGAIVLFAGVVRDNNLGRHVDHLVYEAYAPLAERTMADIAREVQARWAVNAVAIHHRTGRLEIGEASLLVAVVSPHRAEAFEACAYCVDRVKQIVPVWKKEVWDDGSSWIEGTPVAPPQTAGSR
jgi:molybdopterin synthase catalytic subunit